MSCWPFIKDYLWNCSNLLTCHLTCSRCGEVSCCCAPNAFHLKAVVSAHVAYGPWPRVSIIAIQFLRSLLSSRPDISWLTTYWDDSPADVVFPLSRGRLPLPLTAAMGKIKLSHTQPVTAMKIFICRLLRLRMWVRGKAVAHPQLSCLLRSSRT